MGQGYWRKVHLRALKEARHDLWIETGGRAVIAIIIGALAVALIWLIGGQEMAANELVIRGAVTAAILIAFPIVYLWKFAAAPAKMAAEQEAKIAGFMATRANLEVHIGNGAPYEFAAGAWAHRRFHVFNAGPAIADDINVRLREIRPRPNQPAGMFPLDFPLNVFGPDSVRLKPNDQAMFYVFEAASEYLGPIDGIRWSAGRLGRAHNSIPSIYLESNGQWEFDYLLQAANSDDVAFTLIVRTAPGALLVTKKV